MHFTQFIQHYQNRRLLTTGTIEEKIFQRQILKQGLSGAVEGRESTQGHFSKDELKVVFLRYAPQCLQLLH